MNRTPPQRILITGASSGIGRSLALELAGRERGPVAIGLTARRLPLLESLRDEIRAKRGNKLAVELATLDVCKTDSVRPALHQLIDRMGGADCVVVNAGANDLTRVGRGEMDKELNLLQTNLLGAVASVNAAAEHFLGQGSGHIVGISSLASLLPLPKQAAYCASKAGLSMYLNSARLELARKGITVGNITPGFIKTDIVEGVDIGKMPFAVSVEQAARELADLIERRAAQGIVPGWPWQLMRPFFGLIPQRFLR